MINNLNVYEAVFTEESHKFDFLPLFWPKLAPPICHGTPSSIPHCFVWKINLQPDQSPWEVNKYCVHLEFNSTILQIPEEGFNFTFGVDFFARPCEKDTSLFMKAAFFGFTEPPIAFKSEPPNPSVSPHLELWKVSRGGVRTLSACFDALSKQSQKEPFDALLKQSKKEPHWPPVDFSI